MATGPGENLLHYRLIEKIGEGGMGVVWKALDMTLDRQVAIKILPDAFVQDSDRLARFQREAKVLASLNHPNVAAIYGLHEADGRRFLAMELVSGESLSDRLLRGRMALDDALEIAAQIAMALEAAHASGVIHRDLKPANVVMDASDRPKVLDFGLAKTVDRPASPSGDRDLTQSPTITTLGTVAGVILGTAAYMSPEQARGKPVDKRSDIWSFGCLLFEMISGRQPFEGETVTDLLAAIIHGDPYWDALPPEVPASVRRLLALCLRRNPAERLRDAGDARLIIDEIRAGAFTDVGGEARPVEAPRRRTGLLVAVAAAALLVGLLAGRQIGRESAGELPLRKFTIPLAGEDPDFASQFQPRISPDGKHILYLSRDALMVRDLDETEPRRIPGTEGADKPFWSHDSEWIAFERDGRLEKVRLSGGEPTLIAVLPVDARMSMTGAVSWGADDRIVYGTGTTGLHVVPARGGEVSALLDTVEGESDYHETAHLPGDKGWIIVVHRVKEGYGTLGIATPDGQRKYILTLEGVAINTPVWSPTGHIVYRHGGEAQGIWAIPFSLETLDRTGEPFQVAEGGYQPSVADDATLTYVQGISIRRSRLLWLDREGKRLGTIGEPLDNLFPFPDLSPDGTKVLITGGGASSREVFVVDVATGARRQLTFGGLLHDEAVWHPDGTRIVSWLNGTWSLHMTSIDGSVKDGMIGPGVYPAYTRDGSRLLFSRLAPDAWDFDILWMEDGADAETARQFIDGPGVQWHVAPSPDGRHVAYTSDETGRDEVYMTTFPEPGKVWQVSGSGGEVPRWRADGRELYFAWKDTIHAVDVNLSTGAPASAPRLLFRRPITRMTTRWTDGYDVTPDGKRFVVVENVLPEEAPHPAIVIVQNWYAQFESAK